MMAKAKEAVKKTVRKRKPVEKQAVVMPVVEVPKPDITPVTQPETLTRKNGGKTALVWLHPDKGGGYEWKMLLPAQYQRAFLVANKCGNRLLSIFEPERTAVYFYQEIKIVENGETKYLPAPYEPDALILKKEQMKTPREHFNLIDLTCWRDYLLHTGNKPTDFIKLGIMAAGIIAVLVVFFLMWNVVAGGA